MSAHNYQRAAVERRLARRANLILSVAALAAYVRLFFGVDFTDEAFYSALPHVFSLGARPYLDELNITQNAGVLLS